MRKRMAALATLTLMGGFALAGLAFGIARGDASEAHTIRQVFTERTESQRSSQELVAETWTFVNDQGQAEAFVGRYLNSAGKLIQAQYRDASGELVYWSDYQGTGAVCVEHTPPSPKGLQGLTPVTVTGRDLPAEGYRPGGSLGAPALAGVVEMPGNNAIAIASTSFDLEDVTIWVRTEESAGAKRESTLAVNSDGYIVGFWSVTTDPDGIRVGANSQVFAGFESYEASLFDQIRREVDWNAYPECN